MGDGVGGWEREWRGVEFLLIGHVLQIGCTVAAAVAATLEQSIELVTQSVCAILTQEPRHPPSFPSLSLAPPHRARGWETNLPQVRPITTHCHMAAKERAKAKFSRMCQRTKRPIAMRQNPLAELGLVQSALMAK